jgi:carbonic anhydrase/acetyltransferase-like protein (isoleucine patch superfamily)
MPLYALRGQEPQVADDVFVAPTAALIGAVHVAAGASVWFGAVLRADFDRIEIGAGARVQDNVVIHVAEGLPTIVGKEVTIGHAAKLEACVIEDGALIGTGAIVLQRPRVGAGSLVAAGSVVLEGQEIPPGVVAAGVPAVVKKRIEGSSEHWFELAASYDALRQRYLDELTVREETRW